MMADAAPKTKMHDTCEKYEKWKQIGGQVQQYGYCNGVIALLMDYATGAHNPVVHNAANVLKVYFYFKGCRVHT